MGINGVGPLSLQSIALREGNAQGVLHRIDQLDQLKIQLPDTNYVAAIRYYATVGDNEALQELLHCDIHPDILFANYIKSDTPMWVSHMADIPKILRFESPYQHFQKLPRDLPLNHEGHPLRQIFDKNLQGAIVRWGFTYTKYSHEAEASAYAILHGEDGESAEPADFHFARGIRLLAMLRDQGLTVPRMTVRKQAVIRLRDLYRGGGDVRKEALRFGLGLGSVAQPA
ncbi:putative pentatricopeptide repeat domain-containing protein [Diaporthe ampelina]|uniref:Putative pentatricopeptide repeat domain-containing protein n=1 Tax=Diaporthe ampelina TaxID=1214573 RepID=A0A0G2FJZ3_9PEZI|nr:putative pentatricopeptide repeat domain-containing protein [Diaporthe ampelina]